ncbi:extracellular solute-binding protein [Actinospica sp. MGRD01-02]|uniref:Extracellular solute-binding protein n=1 Tax=Actinospica acidithermotolerans TaxID=2828514 RepID=A0A941IGW1_9ACTN|nr:extracellular solute-binding protein [Actinospica acidithermotolerans]MBR7825072.1 extracellular solute-binding protein [Actinospica acidithermotolerans]
MRRSIPAVLASILAASTLAACSSGGSSSTAAAGSTDPASAKGTVTFWDTSDPQAEAPAYKALIAKFEAAYPGIKVTYVNKAFGTAENAFKTAAAGGSGAPDVFRSDIGWVPALAQAGYLQKLDGTPALSDASDYLSAPAATTKYNGATYGVPQVTDALALLYNKAEFTAAGIGSAPTTWAALKTDALAIKAKTGKPAIFLRGDSSYFMLPFIYGEGGDMVDTSGKKVTVGSAAVVKAFGIVQDLISSGAAETDTSSNAYTNMQNAFKSGKVAMVLNGPWSTADDQSGSAFTDKANLGIAPVPAGSVRAGTPTGGQDLVVYAGSASLSASELFVQYINSAASQAYVASRNNTLPTHQAAWSDPQVTGNAALTAFDAVIKDDMPRPAIPQGSDLFTPFDTGVQSILSGKASAQAGLQSVAQQMLKVLNNGVDSGWTTG